MLDEHYCKPGPSLEGSQAAFHAKPRCVVHLQPEQEPEELIAARAKLDSVSLAQQEVVTANAKQVPAPSSQQENEPAGMHILFFVGQSKRAPHSCSPGRGNARASPASMSNSLVLTMLHVIASAPVFCNSS